MSKIPKGIVYEVSRFDKNRDSGHYQINKYIHEGVLTEIYNLTVKATKDGGLDLYCDCPGFRVQKYAKIHHKHVQLVFAYQQMGEPLWVKYTLGKNNKVIFIRASGGVTNEADTGT